MFVKNSTGKLKQVLMSYPQYLSIEPINVISKHFKDHQLDKKKIDEEFNLLVQTYQNLGIEVFFLPPSETYPDSVFARDFGACLKDGYILGRFKHEYRKNERKAYEKKMQKLNIPQLFKVHEGYFEGGDFFFLDDKTIVIGLLERTNQIGYQEIKEHFKNQYEVLFVESDPEFLHLDMCFNLIDEHLALICKDAFDISFLQELQKRNIELIEVSKEDIFRHGLNVQALGDKKVLALKKNHDINLQIKQKGYEVIELDITEILKCGGGIHCMTFPLKRI
jgi:N-dimethylarginine dimethylaminohydrolase